MYLERRFYNKGINVISRKHGFNDWHSPSCIDFAGVMGTPMIGISYDPKIDRFLKSIDEDVVGDLENVTVEALMQEINAKWNNKEIYRNQNLKRMAKLRSLARSNAEMALEFIDKNK